MTAPKKPSARAARRATERRDQKLAKDLERLAALEPGGAADRPIEVVSASEVEVHARSMPCPVCGGAVRVEEHTAETALLGGAGGAPAIAARVRIATVACVVCRRRRRVFFRLGQSLPS